MAESNADPDVFSPLDAAPHLPARARPAGTVVMALGGGAYVLADSEEERRARATPRPDGSAPAAAQPVPAQAAAPDGRRRGRPEPGSWRLQVHGEVDSPVHARLRRAARHAAGRAGVRRALRDQVDRPRRALHAACASPTSPRGPRCRPSAHHVIFEAAYGYTSNVPLREALAPTCSSRTGSTGTPLARAHGAPVARAGAGPLLLEERQVAHGHPLRRARTSPGYWETRGYNNHADPWKEERYG